MRKKAVRIPRAKRAATSRKFQKLIREGYSEGYAARRAYHGRDPNKLTAAERRALKPSQFALPQRKQLPIHNPSHVRNAAARLAQMHKRGTVTEREYASALSRILKAEKTFGIQRTRRDERWNEGYGIHAARSRKHVDAYFSVKPDAVKGAKALAETTGQPVHILRLPSGNIIDEVHPSFQVGRHARDPQAYGDLYEIVDKHGNLLGTASHFGRAITQANEFGESSRLRPVTVFKDREKVATSWGYRRERTSRDRKRLLSDSELLKQSANSIEELYEAGRITKGDVVAWIRASAKSSTGRIYQAFYRPGGYHDHLNLRRREDAEDKLFASRKKKFARDASPRCHVGTEIQSVILDNKYFDRRDALGWIRRHGFHAKKIDATEESFRFRQQEPSQFDHESFRTITLRPGVKAVIGCPI